MASKRSKQRRLQLPGTVKTANETFFDLLVRHQIGLARVSSGIGKDVKSLLDKTEKDLRRAIHDGLSRVKEGFDTPASIDRLQKLLNEIKQIRGNSFAEVSKLFESEMVQLAKNEVKFVAAAAEVSLPVVVNTKLPSPSLLKSVVKTRPFEGKTMKEWAKDIQRADLNRIESQIKIGLVQGESIPQISRRIVGSAKLKGKDGVTAITRRNAEAIARTSVNAISNQAKQEFYAANADIIKEELYVATLDGVTTPICVVGSTIVDPIGDVSKLYRRRYDGDVIVIRTSSGKELVGTPNHPVLTSRGWLPLEELHPGEQVVYSVSHEEATVVGVQDVNVPASIAEFFDAANDPATADVFRERASATDFHGDGMGVDSKVDVLVPKRPLRLTGHSRGVKRVEDELLGRVHLPASLGTDGFVDLLIGTGRPSVKTAEFDTGVIENPIDTLLRSADDPAYLARALPLVEQFDDALPVGFDVDIALASLECWHDASLLQQASDCGRGNFVLPSYLTGGGTATVSGEDVVSVRREFRSTHVYNLETGPGVYIAGGLIVHNCRSLDGERFPVGQGPVPPLHMNCRSVRVAVFDDEVVGNNRPAKPVTQRGLLREFTEKEKLPSVTNRAALPRGTKGQFDSFARKRTRELIGDVPAKTSYQEWLERQGKNFQNDVLGQTKGKLFRDGNLKLDKFVNRAGDELTLSQLATREAAAFRKAGLDPKDFL